MTPAFLLAFGLAVTPVQAQSGPCISPIVPTIQLLTQLQKDGFVQVGWGFLGKDSPMVVHWLVGSKGATKGDWIEILSSQDNSCVINAGTNYTGMAKLPDAPLSPPASVPTNPATPPAGPLVAPPDVPSASPEGETVNL